jgi:hypothetical protein
MPDGRLERLKQALQSVFLTQIPDHPANGGNTGDAEWSGQTEAEDDENEDDEREDDNRAE